MRRLDTIGIRCHTRAIQPQEAFAHALHPTDLICARWAARAAASFRWRNLAHIASSPALALLSILVAVSGSLLRSQPV